MKTGKYCFYLLIVILFLCSIGCSESQGTKNVEVKKVEKIEKDKGSLKVEVEEHQSSIKNLMPEKWKVEKSSVIPVEKLDFYTRSFGGKIVNFENNLIASFDINNNYRFKINVIKAYDTSEAKNIYETILSRTSNKKKYFLEGDIIYEFMANDAYTAKCRSIFSK